MLGLEQLLYKLEASYSKFGYNFDVKKANEFLDTKIGLEVDLDEGALQVFFNNQKKIEIKYDKLQ